MSDREERTPIHCTITPAKLGVGGETVRYQADRAALAWVAERLDVVAVHSLTVVVTATPGPEASASVAGTLEARLTQTSVVTLEAMETTIAEELALTFVPAGEEGDPTLAGAAAGAQALAGAQMLARASDMDFDPEDEDPPEPYSGASIDLGPYIAEALALGLDPHPREPDVAYMDMDTDPEPEAGRKAPFAKLAQLKTKRPSGEEET